MTDKPDRLKLLKNQYLSRISEREKELASLREKVRLIDELETDAERLGSAPTNGALKYSGGKISLVDASLDAVKNIGAGGVNTPKVAKHLTDNGFPPKGKNFIISVGTSLKRLAERGIIDTERREGSRVYMPKN